MDAMEQGADTWKAEIAAAAARLIVEDGLEYGPAKRQALRLLGLPPRTPLPGNDELEDAVFEHIAIFCSDTQAQELAALRRLAARWMERLAPFRPHLGSAVWRGSATRQSDIVIELFCDDCKSAEIALIDAHVSYEPRTVNGMRGDTVEALSLTDVCAELDTMVSIHLLVYDHDDLRGALRHDAKGRTPRGDLAALRELLRGSTP
jgi:hypothetical protein